MTQAVAKYLVPRPVQAAGDRSNQLVLDCVAVLCTKANGHFCLGVALARTSVRRGCVVQSGMSNCRSGCTTVGWRSLGAIVLLARLIHVAPSDQASITRPDEAPSGQCDMWAAVVRAVCLVAVRIWKQMATVMARHVATLPPAYFRLVLKLYSGLAHVSLKVRSAFFPAGAVVCDSGPPSVTWFLEPMWVFPQTY